MRRLAATVLLAAGVVIGAGHPATAHPLGDFTVNTSTAIAVSPGEVRITYVVDLAEIPSFQERRRIDTDGDREMGDDELARWAVTEGEALRSGLEVRIDGRPVALTVSSADASRSAGQGGLDVLRLEIVAGGSAPARGALTVEDRNFPGRVGWREMIAVGVEGTAIDEASVPGASASDMLRAYPDDLLASPPRILRASFSFAPGPSASSAVAATGPPTSSTSAPSDGGMLAGLIAGSDATAAAALVGLLAAFGFGAIHAVGPGHGKTLMAAYVVDRRGGLRQAVTVGLAVAAMHTLSVLGLGLLVVAAERLAPDRVYPWLTALSGLTALGLGAWLLAARLRATRGHARSQERDHDHEHGPADHDQRPHGHPLAHAPDRVLSRRGLVAVAVAGGVLPSPSAVLTLLAALAVGRAAFGLALVAAFSAGLAATLSLVAIGVSRARRAVEARIGRRTARLIPVASAAVIVAVGATLTLRGLAGL